MIRNTARVFRFRRKTLFTLGFVLMGIAIAHRPWLIFFAFSAKGLTNTLVLMVAALVGIIVIHELAQRVLRSQGKPWYIQRGSLLFLPISLLCLNILFRVTDQFISKTFGMVPFLPSQSAMCMVVAAELMWIALLE